MKQWTTMGLVILAALVLIAAGRTNDDVTKPTASEPVSGVQATVQGRKVTLPADPATATPGTRAAIAKGIVYLKKSQLADGGWSMVAGGKESHLGITTVVAYGLLAVGLPANDPVVTKAVAYIVRYAKDDGGIYDKGLRNYTTSIGVMVLKAAGEEKYKEPIAKALAFLKDLQWGKGQGLQPESADFGGAGYGKYKRPDLSNTAWFIEAMKTLGVEKDDPAMENARIFVSRTQAGEAAKGYWIGDGKGGFVYTPHGGGESKAGEFTLPSGGKGLKAYGSMTYAGFLSLIYSGLERDDPRVKAAFDWAQLHWTLEENPELGMQGYYYYLMTLGKSLRAYGATQIVDEQGTAHDWRKELSAKLMAIQKPDGSWANDKSERWYEGNPALATPYALIALDACTSKL